MKIGIKLIAAFLTVAIIVAVVGLLGINSLNRVGRSADYILDKQLPLTDASMEGMISLISGRDLMGEFLLTDNEEKLAGLEAEFKKTLDECNNHCAALRQAESKEILGLLAQAEEYTARFAENGLSTMNIHRKSLAAKKNATLKMTEFDSALGSLSESLAAYEERLTRESSIDKRVDAAMEAKYALAMQEAIAEEYMGLDSLAQTQELRRKFTEKMAMFDALEEHLDSKLVTRHQKFCDLAIGPGNMFDAKDESLRHVAATRLQMAKVDELSSKGDEAMDLIEVASNKQMEEAMAVADAVQRSSKMIIITVTLISFIAAIVVGFFIGRHISVPLGQTVRMIEEMGKGHLDKRLKMNRKDEIGHMAESMDAFADNLQNEVVSALEKLSVGDLTHEAKPYDDRDDIGNALKKTIEDLNNLVSDIQSASEQIDSGAGQVATASQELSQGASEQAASLEEITSSMTQMAAQTKTNADNANQANSLADAARNTAKSGNSQMQEMIKAMQEIDEAGQNISRIIKVIDEIAFQTNLLALNAAVEAARAGNHGKGFAVVAEEVRNLAARSAKAAKETSDLIESSVEKTANGTEIANQTAASLGEIVNAVSKVNDLVNEIASASQEQAEGIDQVTQALSQIDQVTQQNTANAEEGASAAEELSSQASHLSATMATFKVKNILPHAGQFKAGNIPLEEYTGEFTSNAAKNVAFKQPEDPQQQNREPQFIALDDQEFGRF